MARMRTAGAAVALGGLLVGLPAAAPAGAATPSRLGLSLDRRTTPVRMITAPFGDPVAVPSVVAYGTITGCVPGEYLQAAVELTEDGVVLDDVGALGAGESICGADGTARVGTLRWKYGAGGLPHRGWAKATLRVLDGNGPGLDATVTRWVRVPGAHCHGRGTRV